MSCCLVRGKNYTQAFQVLSKLVSMEDLTYITEGMYKLHALVCTKLRPHRYALAVTDYNYLITANPNDMNLYLEQAYLLVALQEYELAADNLSHILRYEAYSITVLTVRAKVSE
jgi:hypothetical protein